MTLRHPETVPLPMDKAAAWFVAVMKGKARLVELERTAGSMACPCGAEGLTLKLSIEPKKGHVRAWCTACDRSAIE